MNGIHGILLLLGDFLTTIPIIIWVIAFVAMCIWIIKSQEPNINIFIIFSIIFYFMIMCKYNISSIFIGAFGIGVIVPIISLIVIPYLLTLLTFLILGAIKNK